MWHLRAACVVAACAASPVLAGGVVFFDTHQAFTEFNVLDGKFLKGIEDFEYSTAPPESKTFFPNPLQNGDPRPHFPEGLASPNLIIQTNITQSPCPPTTNPSANPNALWVNGVGFLGSNSIKVGTDEFLNGMFSSIDLIFTSNDKTGVGVDISTYQQFNMGHHGYIVCVYDAFDNVLGSYVMPGPTPTEPSKDFFGVWSPTPIGRVNIWGVFDQPLPFAVDNIEMWVPAPGAAGLLGLGMLAALRRRR